MKMLFRHIVFIICLAATGGIFPVCAWSGDAAPAAEINADAEALLMVDLINAARKDPLGTAATLGMDTNKIMADFPELSDILINGLPELTFNERLYRSASKHTGDMLSNSYYAYESSDGRTLQQRMNEEGYVPVFSGESLGLLVFNNFISPETAVGRMFANMLHDELDPAGSGIRNILNPGAADIGVSIGGGLYRIGAYTGNAYMATCDFGAAPEVYELELINLINQFRAAPGPVLAAYDIAADTEVFPEHAVLLTEGLPPLAFDSSLYNAAEELAADMFENHHFSSKTADGRTLKNRAVDAGYEAAWLAESRYWASTCNQAVSPAETVSRMFRYLLTRAFHPDPARRSSAMTDPAARDCGIRVVAGQSAILGGICGSHLHITVADFGARFESPESKNTGEAEDTEEAADQDRNGRLIGLVYEDKNANGIYDVGEGLSDKTVIIDGGKDSEIRRVMRTNPAGGYAVALPEGNYRVRVVDSGKTQFSKRMRIDENAGVWIPAVVESVISGD